MSYVDLHCHLLPGLDDGARTMRDTVRHARRLEADGVKDVACTPHVKRAHFPRVPLEALTARRAEAQAAIRAEGVDVRLHPGGELAHEDALTLAPERLELIAQGPPEAPFLLLECPFAGLDDDFEAAAERLDDLGYGLLLAHPERAAGGHERLPALLDAGALLQVNVTSLLGHHGPEACALALDLLADDVIHCLASDGHPGTRDHTVASGFDAVLRAGGTGGQAFRLTQANPRALLRGAQERPTATIGGRSRERARTHSSSAASPSSTGVDGS